MTIRLKKLQPGKHKLTVTYLGSLGDQLPSKAKTLHAQGDQEAKNRVRRAGESHDR